MGFPSRVQQAISRMRRYRAFSWLAVRSASPVLQAIARPPPCSRKYGWPAHPSNHAEAAPIPQRRAARSFTGRGSCSAPRSSFTHLAPATRSSFRSCIRVDAAAGRAAAPGAQSCDDSWKHLLRIG